MKPASFYNWLNLTKICKGSDDHLTNVQRQPTRNGKAVEVFLTNNASLVMNVSIFPGVSDHEGMAVINMDLKPMYTKPKPREIHQFIHADWDKIVEECETFKDQYLSTYHTRTVDENWRIFKAHIMKMLEKHVPKKFLMTRYNLTWFNKRLRSLVHKEQNVYNPANNPANKSKQKQTLAGL